MDNDIDNEVTPLDGFLIFYNGWIWFSNLITLLVLRQIFLGARMSGRKIKPTDFIIANLSVADFISGVLYFIVHTYTKGDFRQIGDTGCSVFSVFIGTSAGQSILMVLLLGYVRYRIMTETPQKPAMTFKRVTQAVAVCWGIAVAYGAFIPITGIAAVGPGRLYCFHEMGRASWAPALLSVVSILLTFMPAFILIGLYLRAFRSVAVAEKTVGMKADASNTVAKMGLAVAIVYFVTVLPWSIMIIYTLILPPGQIQSATFDAIAGTFVTVNWGINPMLYFGFQKNYRNVLRKGLLGIRNYVPSRTRKAVSSSELTSNSANNMSNTCPDERETRTSQVLSSVPLSDVVTHNASESRQPAISV